MLKPTDLLSADEVSRVVGVPVTLAGSADLDEETGLVDQRYEYDLGQSTILGLLQIIQDGGRTGAGSAAADYATVKKLVAKEITPVTYGDDAFVHAYGQLHMLYRGYYLVCAFNGDEEGSVELKVKVNKEIGQIVLGHLRQRIG